MVWPRHSRTSFIGGIAPPCRMALVAPVSTASAGRNSDRTELQVRRSGAKWRTFELNWDYPRHIESLDVSEVSSDVGADPAFWHLGSMFWPSHRPCMRDSASRF